ncbi:hypothetical protein Tco_1138364, partial [Tanacetum coccineum]
MVKMVSYEAFACRCGAGDVVLRESYKPETHGKLYYACPRSKVNSHMLFLVKMVPYEAFVCRCGAGDVVLRESYKPETR